MGSFQALSAIRQFEREHLSFAGTIEDLDIVREVGLRQEAGEPLTLSGLLALNLGSVATVQRRLARLRALEVIEQRPLARDRRSFALLLSGKVLKAYERYVVLMAKASRAARRRRPARASSAR